MEDVRLEVLNAFEDGTGYFFHEIPHRYSGFIDGMAWVGLACGASRLHGDTELEEKCKRYLDKLLRVAKNARNFAPERVKPDWKPSKFIDGYWYKEKPQNNAGPLGLMFAVKNGVNIQVPEHIVNQYKSALSLSWYGYFYGYLARYIESLRQHTNTMFMVYLLKDKKPPSSMKWMAKHNPFFSFVYGDKCIEEYPSNVDLQDVEFEMCDDVVELKYAKPTSWIFRRDPFKKVVDGRKKDKRYVRIAELVGTYLQESL